MPKDTKFKPGQSGNILGGPLKPVDIKYLQKRNKNDVARMLDEISKLSQSKLLSLISETRTPSLKALIAKVYYMGIKTGCPKRLGLILDRLIGKVVEKRHYELEGDDLETYEDYIDKIAKQAKQIEDKNTIEIVKGK